MKSPMLLGERKNDLYFLKNKSPTVPAVTSFRKSNCSFNSFKDVASSVSCILINYVESKLWHVRLSHMPLSNIQHINEISVFICFKFSIPCSICPLARQHKLSFPTSEINSKQNFDLIHIDTWGPYQTPTYDGYEYFLTIVDDFSRGTWTFLLSTKSNAFTILKSFLAMIERQFNKKVKIIRSDNAWELGSSSEIFKFLSS